tara:strand:+ start:217 stop:525 length:309 start_codon:yes stop_codon:yes gene_type:complete
MGKKKKKTVETFSFEEFENGLACRTELLTIDRPFDRQECGEELYRLSEKLYPEMDVFIRQKTLGMILEKWNENAVDLIKDRDLLSKEIMFAEQCYIRHKERV